MYSRNNIPPLALYTSVSTLTFFCGLSWTFCEAILLLDNPANVVPTISGGPEKDDAHTTLIHATA